MVVIGNFRGSRKFSCLFSEVFVAIIIGDFRGIQIYTFNSSCLKYPTVSPSKKYIIFLS